VKLDLLLAGAHEQVPEEQQKGKEARE